MDVESDHVRGSTQSRGSRKRHDMAGKAEQLKGQTKEAIGDLAGNKDLKAEGTSDRHAGEAKEQVEKVKEKVDETVDKMKGLLHKK
jgi:uncharacterized protein YjbJ (UPF0337 family)